jgi:mono/diheme cytochrome c family protein
MTQASRLLLGACLVAATQVVAQPPPATPSSRGELLYSTHCIACHTTQIHWRQKKLATDWASLTQQVRRWAGNAALAWSDEEIVEVARYLNATYYRFETPSGTKLGRGDSPRRIARAG